MTPTKTPFAGLERLGPGDSLSSDGFAFQSRNPTITDFLLKLGAVLHRHDAHAPMVDPSIAPVLATADSGGTIAAALTIYVRYTLTDALGGETLPTAVVPVTTAAGFADPAAAPAVALSFAAGALLASSPMYALSVTDGLGGETALGPPSVIDVPPAAHAEVLLSGLSAITTAASGGAVGAGWRLWRSVDGGNTWTLMATGGSGTDTWTDDGSSSGDCSVTPLTEGTTVGANTLSVTVSSGQPAEATFFSVYACDDGQFLTPCLLGVYPVADLDTVLTFTDLSPTQGQPPDVSLCIGGANQISADDIAGPWKTSVATLGDLPVIGNTDGDTRMVLADHTLHAWNDGTASWDALSGGGGGGSLTVGYSLRQVNDAGPWSTAMLVSDTIGCVVDDADGFLLVPAANIYVVTFMSMPDLFTAGGGGACPAPTAGHEYFVELMIPMRGNDTNHVATARSRVLWDAGSSGYLGLAGGSAPMLSADAVVPFTGLFPPSGYSALTEAAGLIIELPLITFVDIDPATGIGTPTAVNSDVKVTVTAF